MRLAGPSLRWLASAALLTAAGTPALADEVAAARALADAWCAAIVAFDENAALALVTPELQEAAAAAERASAAYEAAHPGEKPPLGDGLPLTGYPDAVSGCVVEDVSPTGALMSFMASPGGGVSWQDELEFAPGPDGFPRVSDVLYAPDRTMRMSIALWAMTETGLTGE